MLSVFHILFVAEILAQIRYGTYNSIAYVLNYYHPFGFLLVVSGSIVGSFPDCTTWRIFLLAKALWLPRHSRGFSYNRKKSFPEIRIRERIKIYNSALVKIPPSDLDAWEQAG